MTSNKNVKKQERGHSLQGGPPAHRTIFKYQGNFTQVREGSLTEVTAGESKKLTNEALWQVHNFMQNPHTFHTLSERQC